MISSVFPPCLLEYCKGKDLVPCLQRLFLVTYLIFRLRGQNTCVLMDVRLYLGGSLSKLGKEFSERMLSSNKRLAIGCLQVKLEYPVF